MKYAIYYLAIIGGKNWAGCGSCTCWINLDDEILSSGKSGKWQIVHFTAN